MPTERGASPYPEIKRGFSRLGEAARGAARSIESLTPHLTRMTFQYGRPWQEHVNDKRLLRR